MANPGPTVKTRLMIISDTHNYQFSTASTHPFNPPFPKIDVLLHCGDLTFRGGLPSYKKALHLLGQIPADLKLVIAGNHDVDLDAKYWGRYVQTAEAGWKERRMEEHDEAIGFMKGTLAREAGVTFLEGEGRQEFVLGNGGRLRIWSSPYTPEFCGWGFAYERWEDRFSSREEVGREKGMGEGEGWVGKEEVVSIADNPIGRDVDVIMTHGPPEGVLDECPAGHVGCERLLRAVERVKPMLCCFGHIHEGNGAVMVEWGEDGTGGEQVKQINGWPEEGVKVPLGKGGKTLFVNASIMDKGYKPVNMPWLVDLQLSTVG